MYAYFGFYLFALLHFLSPDNVDPVKKPTAEAGSRNECNVTNTAFNTGENITYKIAFKWGALWVGFAFKEKAVLKTEPCSSRAREEGLP